MLATWNPIFTLTIFPLLTFYLFIENDQNINRGNSHILLNIHNIELMSKLNSPLFVFSPILMIKKKVIFKQIKRKCHYWIVINHTGECSNIFCTPYIFCCLNSACQSACEHKAFRVTGFIYWSRTGYGFLICGDDWGVPPRSMAAAAALPIGRERHERSFLISKDNVVSAVKLNWDR